MAEAAQPKRAGGGFQRLVLWMLIFGLLAVVWWLASERNERHFHLAAANSVLVIDRGRFFPMGTARIDAADPTYGKAYGPLQIPAFAKVPDMEFEDQASLDRALFDLVQPWAKTLAQKGDVANAQVLVDRASLLPGLTAQQHAQLAGLEGDLAWTTAHSDLQQAARLLLSARRKLEQVRDAAGEHALEASAVSRQLVGVVDELALVAEGKAARGFSQDAGAADAGTVAPAPSGWAPSAAPSAASGTATSAPATTGAPATTSAPATTGAPGTPPSTPGPSPRPHAPDQAPPNSH